MMATMAEAAAATTTTDNNFCSCLLSLQLLQLE